MRARVAAVALKLIVVAGLALVPACASCDGTDRGDGPPLLTDGGTLLPPPPADGGFDDAGEVIPDAGPINTAVQVFNVNPPAGPLTAPIAQGARRVQITGLGFLPENRVFFGDVEANATLTLPINLPTTLSVEVPPCTAPGPVTVRVENNLGVGELEGGFTCFSPVTLTGLSPDHGSTDGGDTITLTGTGMTSEMVVLVGGRATASLSVNATGDEATIVTPPGVVGRVDVEAIDAFGRSRLGFAYTYTAPLTIGAVVPNIVDEGTNAIVEVRGSGFVDGDDTLGVTIAASAAVRDNLINSERIRVVVPASASGAVDVTATRGDDTATLADGLIVRPAAVAGLRLIAVTPAVADLAGGTVHTLVGDGLSTVSEVRVGSIAADFTRVDARTATFVAPPSTAGAVAVRVTREDAQTATLANAITYVGLTVVDSITPSTGPSTGATNITVLGRGFLDVVDVRLGGVPVTGLTITSDSGFTATTPAGAPGAVDMTLIKSDGNITRVRDAFVFAAPLDVLGVRPARGGFGGGTWVTLTGSGFASRAGVQVRFGEVQADEVQVVSDNTITCRTPLQAPGTVDVHVTDISGGDAVAVAAFTFFDPTSILGGARGGPIDGAVYVTALDGSGLPIAGLVAFIGNDGTPTAAGITNVFGQATISGPSVVGAQDVTILGDGYSAATFHDINATELTVYLQSFGGGGGGGGNPPPPPPPPPTVRGRVFGFAKELFDPENLGPDDIAVAIVETTTPDEFSGNPNPGTNNFTTEDGGEYFIANARPGRLALVAVAGIYNIVTGQFKPKQLGIRREVFPEMGVNLTEQDIELTMTLDGVVDFSLPDAPIRLGSLDVPENRGRIPTITRIVPYLQLGGEGTFQLSQSISGSRSHTMQNLPDVPGDMLTFWAGAYTTDGPGSLVNNQGVVTTIAGSATVTGVNTNWAVERGMYFVVDTPTGERFAGTIDVVVSASELLLNVPVAVGVTDASYHIGYPVSSTGGRLFGQNALGDFVLQEAASEVLQDGNGELRGGVTLQPILGLPEPLSPKDGGILVDREFRMKPGAGQHPSFHDMYMYDQDHVVLWQLFAAGESTKIILPLVPEYQAILDAVSLRERTALLANDDFIPPSPVGPGSFLWNHVTMLVPGLDYNNHSYFLELGTRNRRAFTTEVRTFIKGND